MAVIVLHRLLPLDFGEPAPPLHSGSSVSASSAALTGAPFRPSLVRNSGPSAGSFIVMDFPFRATSNPNGKVHRYRTFCSWRTLVTGSRLRRLIRVTGDKS
ncbi:hypothetical protein FKM82_018691 [Ascaphus truei]